VRYGHVPVTQSFSRSIHSHIARTMFKLHSICFTTNKKAHYLAIDYANVLQIENDVSAVRLELKEPFNSSGVTQNWP
jgi:hypothetical protein